MKSKFLVTCLGVLLLGAMSDAQLLSNVSAVESASVHDHADYIDASGQSHTVSNFDWTEGSELNATVDVWNINQVAFPNVPGELDGSYGSLVGNSLNLNTADSVWFHAGYNINSALQGSIESASPNLNIYADQIATGELDFYFTLATTAQGFFKINSTVEGDRVESQFSLTDLDTNTVVAGTQNVLAGYSAPVTLGPGNYRVSSQILTDVVFNRGINGTTTLISDESWVGAADLTLEPAPEPASLVAVALGAAALLRRRGISRTLKP